MSKPTFAGARARRALALPVTRRLAVTLAAVLTGLAVTALVRAAETTRRNREGTRPVVVAVDDLAPGDVVDAGDVEVRPLPAIAVPDAALSDVPAGSVVRDRVVAGEALVGDRLAPEGLTGTAALVPEGHLALAVPVDAGGVPPLTVGDRVDLLATTAPAGPMTGVTGPMTDAAGPPAGGSGPEPSLPGLPGAGGSPAAPLARGGRVVDVGDEAVTVAVPETDAAALAVGLGQGAVALALAGA